MKIGYIFTEWRTPVLRSSAGSIHIQEICSALSRLGHEVFVVAPNKGDQEALQPGLPAVHEIRLPLLHKDSRIGRFVLQHKSRYVNTIERTKSEARTTTWAPKVLLGELSRMAGGWVCNQYFYHRARQIILREHPQALYERYDRLSFTGVRLAEEFGLPLILEMNTSLTFPKEWGNRHTPLYPFVVRRAERKIFWRADKVIVVSPYLERYVSSLGIPAEKIVLMFNAADPEKFRPDTARVADIREQYGLGQKTVIGFIGSFAAWHDVDLILDTAKLVLERCHDVHFLLVGDGLMRSRLESRVRNEGLSAHITFTGSVPHHEAPAYVNAMDITLATFPKLPNFHGSPIKVFEYMAAGKPVIASRYLDTELIIVDRYNGLLVEPGDQTSLAQRILELLEDKALREQLGKHARQTAQEKYTWKENARRILTLYEEVRRQKSTEGTNSQRTFFTE